MKLLKSRNKQKKSLRRYSIESRTVIHWKLYLTLYQQNKVKKKNGRISNTIFHYFWTH